MKATRAWTDGASWEDEDTRYIVETVHRWFAWRPVDTQDRGVRWLRMLWRKRVHSIPLDKYDDHARPFRYWAYRIDIEEKE